MYTAGRQGPVATTRVGGYARQRDPRGHGEWATYGAGVLASARSVDPEGGLYAWQQMARGGDRGARSRPGWRSPARASPRRRRSRDLRGHTGRKGQAAPVRRQACEDQDPLRGRPDQLGFPPPGQLEIKATSVVSTENGYGRSQGTFVLRRTYSPGAAFRGEFVAVLEPDGGGEGFLTGESRGRHPLHLLANFNFDQTSPGHLSGEFGTDSQLKLAVLRGGPGPGDPHQRLLRQEARSRPPPRRRRPPLNLPTCAGTCSIGSGAHRT